MSVLHLRSVIPVLHEAEFQRIRGWIHQQVGIALSEQKKALVSGRLAGRLRHYRLDSFSDYLALLDSAAHAQERQLALDLLTTNETSFFREPRHFDFIRNRMLPAHDRSRAFRVWSAACSSGEEPFSLAMTLADVLEEHPWEVFASDISQRVLEKARTATYALERARTLPQEQLRRHCLKGTGKYEGTFQVAPHITRRVRFAQINLNADLPDLGEFELILLRNVMIYFDARTKQQVIDRVADCIAPGGCLMVGHSESLTGIRSALRPVAPATYVRA